MASKKIKGWYKNMVNLPVMLGVLAAMTAAPATATETQEIPEFTSGTVIVAALPGSTKEATTDEVKKPVQNARTLEYRTDGEKLNKLPPVARDTKDTKDIKDSRVQVRRDGVIAVDPATDSSVTADSSYEKHKAVLDARFAKMFELKSTLDNQQQMHNAMWEEYYSMHQAYQKELKKIIADWVTDLHYESAQ